VGVYLLACLVKGYIVAGSLPFLQACHSEDDMSTLLQRSFEKFCWFVLHSYCKLQTTKPMLPEGPFIICSNHSSHLDTPTLMIALKKPFKDFNMLAAKDHFQPNPNKKSFTQRLMNLILVDREATLPETKRLIRECEQAKAANKVLIIYPEGTRSNDLNLAPFKSGTVYIAYKLNLPIVPAAIKGTGTALPKNRWFIRPKKINIRFGEPLMPQSIEGLSQKEILQKLTKQLEKAVGDLLEQV
jgi:1-acyl-sn-glycerol-3-phosphate acyltransferase